MSEHKKIVFEQLEIISSKQLNKETDLDEIYPNAYSRNGGRTCSSLGFYLEYFAMITIISISITIIIITITIMSVMMVMIITAITMIITRQYE